MNNLHQINDDAKQAELLLDQLDQEFISVTMFLADLTNILKRLINIFQLENLKICQYQNLYFTLTIQLRR